MRKIGKKKGCERPEKLKGKPGECTPEQIRQCHGGNLEDAYAGGTKVSPAGCPGEADAGLLRVWL